MEVGILDKKDTVAFGATVVEVVMIHSEEHFVGNN